MTLLDVVTTISIGLLIGTEFAVSAFINPVLEKLDESARARAVSLFAVRLGAAMPFWYGLSLVLLIVEAIVRRHSTGSVLLIAAAAIWFVVIVITVLVLVPINNRVAAMPPGSFPEDMQRAHKRWDTLHRLRVLALLVAMVCFLLGGPG